MIQTSASLAESVAFPTLSGWLLALPNGGQMKDIYIYILKKGREIQCYWKAISIDAFLPNDTI